MVQDEYFNEEFEFDLTLPDGMTGYLAEMDNLRAGTIFSIQIHPEFNSSREECCPVIDTVYTKSGSRAFLPDSNGIYEIKFASLFDTAVELPDNAKIIENETRLYVMVESTEEATHRYYTKLVFTFEKENEK